MQPEMHEEPTDGMYQPDPELVTSILAKMGRDDRSYPTPLPPLSFGELYDRLGEAEGEVITWLINVDPNDYGFHGSFIGYEDPPENLVAIEGQSFVRNGQERCITTQYLPRHVLEAFQAMQLAVARDTGERLMVESGYRSAAHQAITFLTYLSKHNFNLGSVARGVAFPGFSQHGDPLFTAIDVMNQDGIPTDTEPQQFANTPTYAWMLEHAKEFGFYLSYPPDNSDGIKFEPWHWQFRGKPAQGSAPK